jgi:ribonuclease HIII
MTEKISCSLPAAMVYAAEVATMTSHTAALNIDQAKKLRTLLTELGFEFVDKEYTLYAARKGKLNVSVYQKGPKVLIQGKDTKDFVEFQLEPLILGEAKLGYEEINDPQMFEPHFGIDESGKGDYLGPLVIAGVFTDRGICHALMKAGVMDSKKINTPAKIRKLAAVIRATPGVRHHVVTIAPLRYNSLYQDFGNLNKMLAWGHATVIEQLLLKVPDCPRALSDQFAKEFVLERALAAKKINIVIDQRTKGESDIAVAAASILARETFIDWMDKTSAAGGIELPLGASRAVIEAARKIVELKGEQALGSVAKLHFKSTEQVLDGLL